MISARRTASLAIAAALVFLSWATSPGAAAAQVVYPLEGAPYAAGVASPAGATLAVMGGILGHGGDVGAAAREALEEVGSRLREVGLSERNVLRVRAALAPGADFAAWNEAWTSHFDSGYLPARTTVGSSGLPDGALIALDVVAAFPPETGHPARVDGARATTNPQIRLSGPADNPTAIVSTAAGLFLSSGALPSRNDLSDPESMESHIRSSLNQLTSTLADHGLQWHDAFFVRLLPTPQPGRSTPDFDGWLPVRETLAEMTGHAPAHAIWAAPGFGSGGRFVEIEVWAAPPAPHPTFATLDLEAANPLLVMSGSERSAIASGAMIAPYAELIWISGVVAPDGTAPEGEAAAALTLMRERVESMGASMADVAELRVYRVSPGEEDTLADAWNAAYGAEFNSATNPHKPVRTNYLVESLPGGRHVEVEAVLVRPPRRF
ncbi:MAG TPA: RidA family protein [Longimicrobiales bacterium]|nr:RidA family protein [Longimicrobiales bacterium]